MTLSDSCHKFLYWSIKLGKITKQTGTAESIWTGSKSKYTYLGLTKDKAHRKITGVCVYLEEYKSDSAKWNNLY